MNSTSEKAAVALSMVRELVAAHEHALEKAAPLSIEVSTQDAKPLVLSSSDHTLKLHPEPARQTSGLTGAVESEKEARAEVKTGKGELVQSISPLHLNELPTMDGPIPKHVLDNNIHACTIFRIYRDGRQAAGSCLGRNFYRRAGIHA